MRAISIKMGLWMLMGFVGFFLLAYLLGFGDRSELRVFNGVIHIIADTFRMQSLIALKCQIEAINMYNAVKDTQFAAVSKAKEIC